MDKDDLSNLPAELLEFAEDTCVICGAHIGWGLRLLHLGRCDDHADEAIHN